MSGVSMQESLCEVSCLCLPSLHRWSSLTSARWVSFMTWGPKDCEHFLSAYISGDQGHMSHVKVVLSLGVFILKLQTSFTLFLSPMIQFLENISPVILPPPGKGWFLNAQADIVSLEWTAVVRARPAIAGPNGVWMLQFFFSYRCLSNLFLSVHLLVNPTALAAVLAVLLFLVVFFFL